ncbi:pimeloyl-ACP methyl ester carboxylesterase [Fontibacillus phaseoli]|uniref:Pimeloyl-ACP methyl ester carboxylesterase n=1 Tax=Fontibacillus phaseoli TaxID=1416533 RepID=A0A369B0F5_9BACL|nr:alpha/beta hydrolase [Fontibacillus phaseoli]RCX13916.1 pimeloyl-ACP methyl ester carboxylesterase [Fontibacillus phaseoli]
MDKTTVGGFTMAYEMQGQGETLVLLHGFCGSSAYWERVIPLLAASYRVIAPDLRGHGSSDAPLGAYTIEQMADDVAGLLESLGIERYTLLGHSMGGYVALSLLQRYANRLNGVGLIHSTAYPDSDEAKEKRLQAVAAIGSEGITPFVDGLVPGLFAPELRETLTTEVNRAKEIGYKTPPQGASGSAMAMRERIDRRDVLSATVLPVLLVAGENDQLIPIERTFTTEGDNVTKAVIKGAGHMSMYEAPEQLSAVIMDFLQSIHESEK